MATDVKASKRVNHERLVRFVQAAFEKLGVPNADAQIGADALVAADLRGVDTHGVIRFSLNFSRIEKNKAALYGIKAVSPNSYAKGEERPYGNRVYNRTDGISAIGAARSDRKI